MFKQSFSLFFAILISYSSAYALGEFEEFKDLESAMQRREKLIVELDLDLKVKESIPYKDKSTEYDRVQKLADQITERFKIVFGGSNTKFSKAWVIIVDNERWGGQVFSGLEIKPLFIKLHSGALKTSDSALLGLLAHEFAHLYLQTHSLPEQTYYYNKDVDYEDFLSGTLPFDPSLEENMDLWTFYAGFPGINSSTLLGGVPYSYDTDSESDLKLLLQLVKKSKNKKECSDLLSTSASLADTFYALTTSNFLDLWSADDAIEFQTKVQKIEHRLKLCLSDSVDIFMEVSELENLSLKDVTTFLENSIKTGGQEGAFTSTVLNFYKKLSGGEALLATSRLSRQKMREIEKKVDFSNLKKFTHEDHADIVAAKILSGMKIHTDHFLKELSTHFGVCTETPQTEPHFGPIDWDHHSTCWRRWRGNKFYEYFSKSAH